MLTTNWSLFNKAHGLARDHCKRGWFESETTRLVREIKLRTAIYEALLEAQDG